MAGDENGLEALRASLRSLHSSVEELREERNKPWSIPSFEPHLIDKTGWNFATYSIHINQRFSDLSLQLQQRFEAQQTSVSTAMVAAEKAVNAALTAAEKAVDKAEQAQGLRNQAQNEFRQSLSDLSGLMWTTKEGTAALESLRRETDIKIKGVEDTMLGLKATSDNLQGKIAMIGMIWGVFVVIGSAAFRYFIR